jgi:hypothetical protein
MGHYRLACVSKMVTTANSKQCDLVPESVCLVGRAGQVGVNIIDLITNQKSRALRLIKFYSKAP